MNKRKKRPEKGSVHKGRLGFAKGGGRGPEGERETRDRRAHSFQDPYDITEADGQDRRTGLKEETLLEVPRSDRPVNKIFIEKGN